MPKCGGASESRPSPSTGGGGQVASQRSPVTRRLACIGTEPPVVNGFVVDDESLGMRLVDYAKAHLATVPVREVGPLIAQQRVTVNDRRGRMDDRLLPGDVVSVVGTVADRLVPLDHPITIAYEDGDLIVCDKPAGMHVHPVGPYRHDTLINALLWHAGARSDQPWAAWRPYPAHRLDRAARGLVAVAKRAAVHDAFRQLLQRGAVTRRYHTLVEGSVTGEVGTIDAPLGRDPTFDYRRAVVPAGDAAVTHWRVIERLTDQTLLSITLHSGRTHQIRAHLAHLEHPIVGDTLYGGGETSAPAIDLHATELRFPHPISGVDILCVSEDRSSGGSPGT